MKKYLKFFSVILTFCCFINFTFAGQQLSYSENCQKHYIQGADVRVANNGIFVNFEGDILCVNAVYVDDAGAYILGFGCCRYCNRPNDDLGRCQNGRCKNYGKP